MNDLARTMSDNDVTLTIRLPRSMRDAFQVATTAADITASQVLRAAIRQYLTGQTMPIGARPIASAAIPVAGNVAPPSAPSRAAVTLALAPEAGASAADNGASCDALSGIRAMLQFDDD